MYKMTEDDPTITYISIEEATKPPGGLIEHLRDKWWSVHPTKGLIFYVGKGKPKCFSPQCNSNEDITRRIQEMLYPWAEVRFMPSVFIKRKPSDYKD